MPFRNVRSALRNIWYLVLPAREDPTSTTLRSCRDLVEAPVSLASFTSLRYVSTASSPCSTMASGGIRQGLLPRSTSLKDIKKVARFKAPSTSFPKPSGQKKLDLSLALKRLPFFRDVIYFLKISMEFRHSPCFWYSSANCEHVFNMRNINKEFLRSVCSIVFTQRLNYQIYFLR